jgi:1,4-alpha-glucan branching enzyme
MNDAGEEIIAVCNFVPVERRDYRIGVPAKGRYKVVFDTDAKEFGGEGLSAKSYKSDAVPMHGFDDSIALTLPPLSVQYLKYSPVKRRAAKSDPGETPVKKTKAPSRKKASGGEK